MDEENNTTPEQRAKLIAAVACLVALIVSYLATRSIMKGMPDSVSELVVLLSLPVAVTFGVLYRSHWHQEMTGVSRTCSLLALSCLIVVGETIGISVAYGLALFSLMAISGGNH